MEGKYKITLILFVVLIPALCVGISNRSVFPDAVYTVNLMIIASVGVACTFTALSAKATDRVRQWVLIADIAIAAVLFANLAAHLIMARDISAAKQSVEESNAEDDRQDARETRRIERKIAESKAAATLAESQAKLQAAEAARLRRLPIDQRRSAISTPPEEAPTIPPLAASMTAADPKETIKAVVKKLTPEEVRESWRTLLIWLVIGDCGTSVLAGAILMARWEWDRNGNGIPDHLETPRQPTQQTPGQTAAWLADLDDEDTSRSKSHKTGKLSPSR